MENITHQQQNHNISKSLCYILKHLEQTGNYQPDEFTFEQFISENGEFFTFQCLQQQKQLVVKYTFIDIEKLKQIQAQSDQENIEVSQDNGLDLQQYKSMKNEIQIFKYLREKSLVQGAQDIGVQICSDFIEGEYNVSESKKQIQRYIALIYENLDLNKTCTLIDKIELMQEKDKLFTQKDAIFITRQLARSFSFLQEQGILCYFISGMDVIIDKSDLQVWLFNIGHICQIIGRNWFHYSEETPKDVETLKDSEILKPKMLQYQEDIFLPDEILKNDSFTSGYNTFTYSFGVLILSLLQTDYRLFYDSPIDQAVNSIGRQYEINGGIIRLLRELLTQKLSRRMSFITFNHILELVGDEIFTMSKFEMAKIINEQLQHDIDHQVEYDIALQQSSQYLDTKRSEIFQEKDDSKNSFLSKGLWNTNLMIKYFPIKNNYKVYKTVQTMPKGSETILVRSDLAFVIGGYDTFSPNIITNTLFAFEFPEELNAREELKYDYVYELQQKAALIVKKVNYALVSSPSFICLIGGKISTGGDNQQLRITNLCEIYIDIINRGQKIKLNKYNSNQEQINVQLQITKQHTLFRQQILKTYQISQNESDKRNISIFYIQLSQCQENFKQQYERSKQFKI